MSKTNWKVKGAALLIASAAVTQAQEHHDPALSTAEAAVIRKRIATLKTPGERKIAENWSNAKKVAELICRPAALPVLKKQAADVDRVFLGTDDPKTLDLEGEGRLSGQGQFRTNQGWQQFTFTCDVDPKTGRVTDFQPAISKNTQ